MFLAHWNESKQQAQSLQNHSENVACLMQENCFSLGLSSTGKLIGLLHDVGKANPIFQTYMLENQIEKKGKINHAAAGAQLLKEKIIDAEISNKEINPSINKLLFQLCSMAILGHHRGLMDVYDSRGESPFEKLLDFDKNKQVHEDFINELNCQEEIDELINEARIEISQIIKKINMLIKERPLLKKSSKEELIQLKYAESRFTLGLIERFLFSSLIDSDRLDAACFAEQKDLPLRENRLAIWEKLRLRLENALAEFSLKNPLQASEALKQIRNRISEACMNAGQWPYGIYCLQAITGSGKTLASLRLALHHACNYPETQHIIYVIPYLSILLQNAKSIKDVLHLDDRSDWILEHYSDYFNELMNDCDSESKQQDLEDYELHTERWDSPIIITSLVHFLNTFYSGRKKDLRRLHQLSNSVIIFDEIQSIPDSCISMFNSALNMLKHLTDVKVILCSATLPPLDQVKHPLQLSEYKNIDSGYFEDSKNIHRVSISNQAEPDSLFSAEEIADLTLTKQQERNNALTIMNTIAGAIRVYNGLKERIESIPENQRPLLILLTTNLCPDHKKSKIQELIQALNGKKPVLCVSTSLIEAGVDISFDVVLRACSGLDSLIQAAGRCNRHDHKKTGELIVFYSYEIDFMHNSAAKNTTVSQLIRRILCSRIVLEQFKKFPEQFDFNLLSDKALAMYYQNYYEQIQEQIDYPVSISEQRVTLYDLNAHCFCWTAKENLNSENWPMHQAFQTAGRYFKVIDDYSIGVLVPYKKGDELIEELNSGRIQFNPEVIRKLKRQAQNYTVNLSEAFIRRRKENFVYHEAVDLYYLKASCYNEEIGVTDFEAQSWMI
ncbi:CRISPR-associated helicase/endonuclease Cas3 [Holdemania massiliensis]|uniref:CRISPR-associated helicase/endonuclease Cas3 n=1 Tax=Holdemania massiliensis TaxID=1468449 RepID=UPI0002E1579A|nr:CRISPR-associated helicase/endonuclease Cas3 [Holdemania massiliensis]